MNNRLKTFFVNGWVDLLCRWILGIVFVFASYHKIINPAQFAKIIYGYQLVPPVTINMIAIILPFLELFCGMALIVGIFPRSAAMIINVMLLGFIFAISFNLLRGHQFDCGCFSFNGASDASASKMLLIRDAVLLIASCVVCFYREKRKFNLNVKALGSI